MPYKVGESGNPGGRPKGSVDKAKAVLDGICIKARKLGLEQPGDTPGQLAAKWVARLDDRTLAGLYGKLLPREQTIHQDSTPEGQYSDIISRLEDTAKTAENAQNSASKAQTEASEARVQADRAEALAQANKLLANRQAKGMEGGAHKSLSSKGPAQPEEVK